LARRPSLLIFRGRIGTPLEQELGRLAVALRASDDQGSVAELISDIHVGAVIEKERRDVPVVGERGLEERGSPLHVTMVDRSAVLDQIAADVEAAVLGREAERCSASNVRVVEGGALRTKPADEIEIARVENGQEQRVASEIVFRVDTHTMVNDSFDGGSVVLPDGVKQALFGCEALRNARFPRSHDDVP
jgi:hypothetical protein